MALAKTDVTLRTHKDISWFVYTKDFRFAMHQNFVIMFCESFHDAKSVVYFYNEQLPIFARK